ncbi:T9SS type A sorting domain-containing protein, partial [Algoriphagus iocasae]
VKLPSGKHILRFVLDSNGQNGYFGNLNSMRFTLQNEAYRINVSSNIKGKNSNEAISTKAEVGEKLIFLAKDEDDAIFEYWTMDGVRIGDQSLIDIEMPNRDITLTKHFRAPLKPEVNIALSKEYQQEVEISNEANIDVEIKSNDGIINKIELFDGNILISELTKESTRFNWKNIPEGNHELIAKITDNNGEYYFSKPVVLRGTNNSTKDINDPLLKYIIGPNPTHDYLNIFFTNLDDIYDFEFKVISMNGVVNKLYEAKHGESKVTIDVSDLINGVYILQVTSRSNYISSKKFIKK